MPDSVATRDTDSVLGPRKDQLGGPGPRTKTINADEWNRIVDLLFAILLELGDTDGTTPDSVWEAIGGGGGGGGFSYVSVTADATLPSSNAIVDVDTSGLTAPDTLVLTLPAAAAGRVYIIRKTDGAANETITLGRAASEMIDGLASDRFLYGSDVLVDVTGFSMPHAVWTVYCDGTNWHTFVSAPSTRATLNASSAPVDTTDHLPTGFYPGSFWHESSGDAGKLYVQTGNDAADGRWVRLDAVDVLTLSADATLPAKDRQVFVTTAGGVVNLTLPRPTDDGAGRQFVITKTNTDANKITLVRHGAENINGVAASYDLPGSDAAAIGRWHVSSDGTNWWVF